MKRFFPLYVLCSLLLFAGVAHAISYPIVDTNQSACFNDSHQIRCPEVGDDFNGQDGQYRGKIPRYRDNGDGTVSDLVTGLMWVQERGDKLSWNEAMAGAKQCRVGGHTDWRAPTIKELYSLIDFNGWVQRQEKHSTPFINTDFFDFAYGDTNRGERIIDCQDWSSTLYVSTTMGGAKTAFGVNFADGRIKGYPTRDRGTKGGKYIRYVRGNTQYGNNEFVSGIPGTVSDKATGLVWQQSDSGQTYKWKQALGYCENLTLGGRTDWRLPSAKELQSIVDYSRSPKTTNSAAIDPIFSVTDPESYFWTSTTHLDGPKPTNGVYIAFGRAMGYFSPPNSNAAKRFLDVHGAGAQRSDPKDDNPAKYPQGHGPQGDDIRINNYVRCVAGGGVEYYEPYFERIPTWKGGKKNSSLNQDPNMGQPKTGRGPGQMHQGGGKQGGMQSMGRRQGPPQEAFDACEAKDVKDECSVETPRGTLEGICLEMRDGKVCVPENHRGGPPRQ